MSVIAFIDIPNGSVGANRVGHVITTKPAVSVVPLLDNPADAASIQVQEQVGSNYQSWVIQMTPARAGIVWMTIQVQMTGGVTEERRVAIIVVPEGDTPPAGGSQRFRKLLPLFNSTDPNGATPVYVKSTSDNGFFLICTPTGTYDFTIDGLQIAGGAYQPFIIRFDANGVAQWYRTIGGCLIEEFTVDDNGNAFMLLYAENSVMRWFDNTGIYATEIDNVANQYQNGKDTYNSDRWLCRLNADGSWSWRKKVWYIWNGPGGLVAKAGRLYFPMNITAFPVGAVDELGNPVLWEASANYNNEAYVAGSTMAVFELNPATGSVIAQEAGGPSTGSALGTGRGLIINSTDVDYDGNLYLLMTSAESALTGTNTPWGIVMSKNTQAVAIVPPGLASVTAYCQVSNDRNKLEILSVRKDSAEEKLWFNGIVDPVATGGSGAKFGPDDAYVNVPWSGSQGDSGLFSLTTSLYDAKVVFVGETLLWSGFMELVQPGLPVNITNVARGDGAGYGPDVGVIVPEVSSDPVVVHVNTAGRTPDGASEGVWSASARPNGGAIVAIVAGGFAGSAQDLVFTPDPANAPLSIPGGETHIVLATIDADGGWSGELGAPAIGTPDPIIDLPVDGLDPGTWGEGAASTPGAPGPSVLPDFNEDSVFACRLEWLDHDAPDETQSYTVEFAAGPDGPWSEDRVITGGVYVEVLSDRRLPSDRFIPIVVIPEADWFGSYGFYARVRKSNYPTDLVSAVAHITGTVVGATDAPSQPAPSRMPTVEAGVAAQGTFTFVDPDGASWTVAVSATRDGTYGSSVSLPGKGTITVVDPVTTDHTFDLRYDPVAGGYTGTYSFWVKVTDSTGLASTPLLVSGVVSSANVTIELQRITRTSTSATIEALTPLTAIIDMDVTEAIDGPGAATLTVAASELKRRAATLGITPASLIKAGSVEVKVSINGTPVFTGPITGYRHDIQQEQVTIDAIGLMGYLEARAIEGSVPKTFTGEEQSSIVWSLLSDEQDKPYGSLALTNGTTNTGSAVVPSISFEPKVTVASAIYELRDRLNGPEVWIDADRVIRTAVRRGTDRRKQIVFTPQNTSRFETSTDWKVLSNVVNVYGTGATSTASDTASLAAFGRMVKPLEADQLTTEAACAAVAGNFLGDLKELPEAYYIVHDANPERPFGLLDYSVGDAVTIEADTLLGRITADVRIVSRTIRLVQGTSSSFDVELTLERISSDGVIRARRSDHNPELVSQLYDALYRR